MSQRNPAGSDPSAVPGIGAGDESGATDCSSMIARLYHYLDGELTTERRTRIQAHLDGCPSCFSAFDFEAELRIVVSRRVHTTVPESLVLRIRQAICQPRD